MCDSINFGKRHPRANPTTGLVDDKTGQFKKVVKKKRELNIPKFQEVRVSA
jgi:hypothetical protein